MHPLLLILVTSILASHVSGQTAAFAVNTAAQKAILDRHNYYRSAVGVANIAWDVGLASDSQKYAATCMFPVHDSKRSISPSNSQPTIFTSVGENMYGSSPPSTNLTTLGLAAVNSFGSEKPYYLVGKPTGSNCMTGKVCGHYTQIVWRNSLKVGCGYATCTPPKGSTTLTGSWSVVVCRYGPSGNFIGQIPYEETENAHTQDPINLRAPSKNSIAFVAGVVVVALVVAVAFAVYKNKRASANAQIDEMSEALA
jgi:pathogenesis-related protein 1